MWQSVTMPSPAVVCEPTPMGRANARRYRLRDVREALTPASPKRQYSAHAKGNPLRCRRLDFPHWGTARSARNFYCVPSSLLLFPLREQIFRRACNLGKPGLIASEIRAGVLSRFALRSIRATKVSPTSFLGTTCPPSFNERGGTSIQPCRTRFWIASLTQ